MLGYHPPIRYPPSVRFGGTPLARMGEYLAVMRKWQHLGVCKLPVIGINKICERPRRQGATSGNLNLKSQGFPDRKNADTTRGANGGNFLQAILVERQTLPKRYFFEENHGFESRIWQTFFKRKLNERFIRFLQFIR